MEISCHEIWREISNYLDHDVEPAVRERMERHFANCRHCAALIDSTHNVLVLIGDDRAFAVPAEFSKRLYTKLAAHLATRP
jgi:anti-sigma factor (TIGR02949 family)